MKFFTICAILAVLSACACAQIPKKVADFETLLNDMQELQLGIQDEELQLFLGRNPTGSGLPKKQPKALEDSNDDDEVEFNFGDIANAIGSIGKFANMTGKVAGSLGQNGNMTGNMTIKFHSHPSSLINSLKGMGGLTDLTGKPIEAGKFIGTLNSLNDLMKKLQPLNQTQGSNKGAAQTPISQHPTGLYIPAGLPVTSQRLVFPQTFKQPKMSSSHVPVEENAVEDDATAEFLASIEDYYYY